MTFLRRNAISLLAVACALSFIAQVNWRPAQFALLAELRTDAPALIELRYNRGYGVRQEGISPTILESTDKFIRVRFPIEVNEAQGLRLVNFGVGHSLEIRSLTLKPLLGSARSLAAAELSSRTPKTEISQRADVIHVLSSGTEPTVLHLELGSRPKASRSTRLLQWMFVIPLFFAGLGLVRALWREVNARRDNAVSVAHPNGRRRHGRTIVIGALLLGYCASSLLGLNGSSTALWHNHADRGVPNVGVVLGVPQPARSDEWMLQTPWIFSQARRTPAFSPTNPNVGSDVTPLVTNLPVRHWSTVFRPQMWPFFLLSTERAFAFYWNFKSFFLLLGALLFLGVLTGRKTALDLAGAVFLTFSPFVQWWFSTPTCLPEMLAMLFFALWLSTIVYHGRAWWQVATAAACLIIAIENFIFCCYPRFQIPLVYLAAALLLGGLITSKARDEFRTFRLCCVGLVITTVTLVTWFWWRDIAEIIRITSLLSYPGQMRFTGGGFEWNRFFDPFLEFSMKGDRFPEKLRNACEASGFLLLAPLLALPAIRDALRRRFDWLLVVPLVLIAGVTLYMIVGIPMWAAKASGWAYVTSGRANLLVGVATTIALVRYLARGEKEAPAISTCLCLFGGCVLLLIPVLNLTNVRLGHFETSSTIVATAFLVGLITLCLWIRSVVAACILLIVPQFYACALINPIMRGVPGITQSGLLHWLAEAQKNRPDGKWIILGDTLRAQVLPDFVKASGADVLGGMRCNPDYEMLRILDPGKKYVAFTNSYAWIHFKQADVDAPVLEETDGLVYDIKIPLSQDLLDRLGVKHILEVDMPADQKIPPGFHLVGTVEQCRLLERD